MQKDLGMVSACTFFTLKPNITNFTTMAHAARILEHPEDVTVLVGEPATLQCRVSEGSVVWFKDGQVCALLSFTKMWSTLEHHLFFIPLQSCSG